VDPTAISDHEDLLLGFAKGGHHLMDVLAQFLGIKMGHDFITNGVSILQTKQQYWFFTN